MKYNFDDIPCREGTCCEKWDNRAGVFGKADVLPLWIADMDFEVPPFVTEAIVGRAAHKLYGYGFRSPAYYAAIAGWVKRRNGWEIKPEWIGFSPGVVAGFTFGIRAVTAEGDGVVIMRPSYPPFAHMIEANGRRVIDSPLKWNGQQYEMDFEDLDRKLAGAKALLFCNPHNPTGRVFSPQELQRVGELCCKHDVYIVSDEIHSDLIQKPYRHTHIASLSPELARRTITLIAPSKTFNIAGLSTSVVIIPDDELRGRFDYEFDKIHAGQGNTFGTVACQAAYEQGDEWLDQCLEYIHGNMDYVYDFMTEKLPRIKVYKPQGTYLMWLDFRALGMTHDELLSMLVHRAGLGFDEGRKFGTEGICFMRLNLATSRKVLEEAMRRLYETCKDL